MGRAPCCEKVGIKRGRWTAEEDQILANYIQSNGEGSWRSLPKNAGLKRCGKSCRLRWINYLRSDLKRGNITREEEELVVKLHSTLGNRWSLIASHLPGRTDNELKNYWNSHLSRKLHNFMRKPSLNGSPAPEPPQAKRRPGRTSRSAMKPKTHRTKPRKIKKTSTMESTKEVGHEEEEGALMIELSGAEGACDYYGDENMMSINDENGVLSFDDDIVELLLEPSHVNNTSCGGEMELNSSTTRGVSEGTESNQGNFECLQSCPSVESFLNYENQVNDYALTDWNCVWQDNNNNYSSLWDDKEGPGSMVSWLLEGDDEDTIGKSNCENFGEPLDHDEENALVSWLLS